MFLDEIAIDWRLSIDVSVVVRWKLFELFGLKVFSYVDDVPMSLSLPLRVCHSNPIIFY